MATRSNEAWLSELRTEGPERGLALADLREVVRHGLPYALSRWLSPDDPLCTLLVEEVTREAFLRVLGQLEDLRRAQHVHYLVPEDRGADRPHRAAPQALARVVPETRSWTMKNRRPPA